jgi:predicted aspartyl protease
VAEEPTTSTLQEGKVRDISGIDGSPFLIPLFLNKVQYVDALVDSGCTCFCAISPTLARRVKAEILHIPPRKLRQAVGTRKEVHISQIALFQYDLDGWESRGAAYVVPGLDHDVILGRPWMDQEKVLIDSGRGQLTIGRARGMIVQELSRRHKDPAMTGISAAVALAMIRRGDRIPRQKGVVITTSIHALTRVIQDRTQHENGQEPEEDLITKLPKELRDFKDLFGEREAATLPPHRGRLDHHIRLIPDQDGRPPALPWGPLYSMPRDQLLELRRQITDLMDKGWIRASASSAGAPVLLVKKPGGKWRFCVDYRGLNRITQADRYPLPLIKETLRTLSTARWFTKVDVRSAFYRVRVAEGDEHLTAFRTRFGLFEWLVCPMGLTGAPATFQRYINKALRETLGDFTTAYLDDVLIYSGGSRKDHITKVRRTLQLLREAGLHLDIKKCVFAVKTVHYLGYVIQAGEAVQPDPEKVQAIRDWEPPTSVRAVRSFLGFANFYRDFIQNFSAKAAPLYNLTKRTQEFQWDPIADNAFSTLKAAFMAGPILAQWNPDRETVVEADCSGGALGGCLSQRIDGVLHPVAYHSATLTPEQRNYTIHDKELTAVVKCIEAWAAELQSVRDPFTVLTDHKNLEYFTSSRTLSERQHRWSEFLSRFRYQLQYRPGRLAARPDALSRREQDAQEYVKPLGRVMTPVTITSTRVVATGSSQTLPKGALLFADAHMQRLWDEAVRNDTSYEVRLRAVQDNLRTFPPEAKTRQQIGDCTISAHGTLQWRGVTWVPTWEPLTTTIIHRAHESQLTGHPGRNTTFQIIRRSYHWDGMTTDVARYVRNCHCYGAHVSRVKRQGLLQPLPIADRFWSQISMDFMVDLPQADTSAPRYLLVITDRLSKYVQLEAMTSMTAEACADRFRDVWWRFHGFPASIITDRGSDWLGLFWTTLCGLVKTKQLLSTAHHPQTDGGTERANQEVQAVLRIMVNFSQTNWPTCLPACQLALNNRDSSVTGMSPNLLLNGYSQEPIQPTPVVQTSSKSPKGRAVQFVEHLRNGMALTQAAIAFTQQKQQESTNASRRPAERYQVGDKVWFSMRNVKTVRASRKLDWLQVKYTVTAVPSPLTVTLDLPGSLHKTVHVDLVERAATDPLPSQPLVDARPGPALGMEDVNEDLCEWEVEEILGEKNARGRNKRQVLVKWKGWLNPTWHPKDDFLDTEALRKFSSRSTAGNVNKQGESS